jgi:hypothetical protein
LDFDVASQQFHSLSPSTETDASRLSRGELFLNFLVAAFRFIAHFQFDFSWTRNRRTRAVGSIAQ